MRLPVGGGGGGTIWTNKWLLGGFGVTAAVILVVTLVVLPPQGPTTVGNPDPPVRQRDEPAAAQAVADDQAAAGQAADDGTSDDAGAQSQQPAPQAETQPQSPEFTVGDDGRKTYLSRPPLALNSAATYFALIEMEDGGVIEIELFADAAPETVNSFVFLARDGFYDGLTFHRVIDGFVAQGGDPLGTGTGGPGYTVPRELSDHLHVEGAISMARSADPDSAGSQFYICLADVPFLDGEYAVFGMVRSGMETVHAIPKGEPPASPGVIKTIRIEER